MRTQVRRPTLTCRLKLLSQSKSRRMLAKVVEIERQRKLLVFLSCTCTKCMQVCLLVAKTSRVAALVVSTCVYMRGFNTDSIQP